MASRVEPPPDDWTPRTELGRKVLQREITEMEEVITSNLAIQEHQVVRLLLPDLEYEVIEVNLVQKKTDAGQTSSFRSTVAVGNRDGWIGVAADKARQVHGSIEKALNKALLSVVPVRLGCGSWECVCGTEHSLRVKAVGKGGSVKVEILPGPRGLGIVAADTAKTVIQLAGVNDCWVNSFGETRTALSFALATYDALKRTFELVSKEAWIR